MGSISAGGAGKTPFLIALAALLREMGYAPDVLSRGYGRTSKGVLRVNSNGPAETFGDEPLLLLGTARLGAARDQPALFVQLQSPRECGSAGCNTQVYAWVKGAYVRVLDGVSGTVTVAPTRHRGMADLRVGSDRYVWNGAKYEDVRPAPAVNLRPRG